MRVVDAEKNWPDKASGNLNAGTVIIEFLSFLFVCLFMFVCLCLFVCNGGVDKEKNWPDKA